MFQFRCAPAGLLPGPDKSHIIGDVKFSRMDYHGPISKQRVSSGSD